jgi:hypothetical protein
MTGEEYWTLIEGSDFGLSKPSGLTLIDNVLLVTDNETSQILAFDLDGELIDQLQTPFSSGSLMGIYAASLDDIWLVNALDNEIWRLQPDGADSTAAPRHDEYTSW